MHRKLSLVLVLGLGLGLGACQVADPTSEATIDQELGGSVCSATLPILKTWDGSAPPIAGDDGVYVIYPIGVPLGSSWLAALVTENAQIPWATMVPDGKLASFMPQIWRGSLVGPGTNPPPPPCNLTVRCGHQIAALGVIAKRSAIDAANIASSCPK